MMKRIFARIPLRKLKNLKLSQIFHFRVSMQMRINGRAFIRMQPNQLETKKRKKSFAKFGWQSVGQLFVAFFKKEN